MTRRQQLLSAGAQRLGWKAGLGSAAARKRFSLGGPMVGFLTSQSLLEDGQSLSITDWENPMVEPEVAVRLRADLPAGSSASQALAALESVGPAIEVIDAGAMNDLEEMLGGNLFHRAVVVGVMAPLPEAGLTSLRLRLRVEVNEDLRYRDIAPAELVGDLPEVLCQLANQLAAEEQGVLAGDVVITGSVVDPLAVFAGQAVSVGLNESWQVSLRLIDD